MNAQWFQILADLLLVFHTLLVVFVIFGLVATLVGYFRQWNWVRNLWFRLSHLVVIGIVVLQAWLGVLCPLTIWEMELRAKAGQGGYEGSFIQHWLETILYYNAPDWVFILVYTLFGTLVVASWFLVKPRR
ncbi:MULTISPECIES: DUF2784 domain-containing protein [Marinobacter]|jgi:hypothetical protein|uniref:Putative TRANSMEMBRANE PROTEIN n=1 Tax=Marinobacter excellens LAMA 842 TaxID=1306954 RepID=A0A137S5T7_9GAMM|nr:MULTISPECIES: DUF2784 domain-containing protein [Marinobacter]KXO07782.1 putative TRANSMEMBRANE PROTEIN [Marinobacter excellens LAMA 842]MCD1629084.1 DUF2784 domain-containing protein [Marinobacter shengliensis]WBU40316.1 DUF2784 domain-containing protein [Marinobacter alkaliphilus]